MEQRLIDANALSDSFWAKKPRHESNLYTVEDIDAFIDDAPTIDPVKHGRWKHWIENLYRCSICGYYTEYVYCNNFCPNCGAKMDDDGGTP